MSLRKKLAQNISRHAEDAMLALLILVSMTVASMALAAIEQSFSGW